MDKGGLHNFLTVHERFLLMALAHHFRGKIVFVEKLKVKTASAMSHDNEVFVLRLCDESIFKVVEGVGVQHSILIFMLNFTPVNY